MIHHHHHQTLLVHCRTKVFPKILYVSDVSALRSALANVLISSLPVPLSYSSLVCNLSSPSIITSTLLTILLLLPTFI